MYRFIQSRYVRLLCVSALVFAFAGCGEDSIPGVLDQGGPDIAQGDGATDGATDATDASAEGVIIPPDGMQPDTLAPDTLASDTTTPPDTAIPDAGPGDDGAAPDAAPSPDGPTPDTTTTADMADAFVGVDALEPDVMAPDTLSPDTLSPDTLSPDTQVQQPDIVVNSISCTPDPVAPGFNVSCTVEFGNIGSADTGAFSAQLYLSTDAVITSGDTLLTGCSVASIAASATETVVCQGTVPAATSDGSYYVGVIGDSSAQVTESDETNNTGSDAVTVATPTPPDIVVQSVNCTPTPILPGALLSCQVTLANTGATAAGAFSNQLRLSSNTTINSSDPLLGSCASGAIPAGATTTISCAGTIPASTPNSVRYAGIVADSSNLVTEASETNNTGSDAIRVDNRPDIRVTTLNCPSTVTAGQSRTCSVTVRNDGAVSTGAGFTLSMRLSTNSVISTGDTAVGSCTTGALGARTSRTLNCTATVPSTYAGGSRWFGVIADYPNVIAEYNEGNNTRNDSVTVTALPDLTVTAVNCPPTVAAGQAVSCSVTIRNTGLGASPAYVNRLYFSTNSIISTGDTLVATCSGGALAAGASRTVTCSGTLPAGAATGSRWLGAYVDPLNAIAEVSNSNNTRTDPVNVIAAGPDIVVQSVNCPTDVPRGAPRSCSIVFRNQGAVATGGFTYQMRLSTNTIISNLDTLVGTCTETSIAPGGTNNDSCVVNIPPTYATGPEYLGVIADSTGAVAETFENNNTGYDTVNVTALPDLAVTSVSCGATSLGRGQPARCVVRIENQGTAAASSFSYRLYLSTNQTISTSDTLLGTCTVSSLAAGATTNRVCTGTIPPAQATGSYYIGARADPTNQITEESTSNNSGGADPVTIVATGQPDLDVITVNCPPTVSRNTNLSCVVSIRNIGSATAGASTAELRLSTNATITTSDTLLGTCNFGSMVPGFTRFVTCTGRVPGTTATGTLYGGIRADSGRVVAESNESNNTGADQVVVQ